MKKGLKIALIVLIGIIAFDTLQAKIFNNSPLLKIRNNLDSESINYIDKGIFVNHYHCSNKEKVTTWKGIKFACPEEENSDEKIEKEIVANLDKIAKAADVTSSNPFDYTNNRYYKNIVNLGKKAVPVLEDMYKKGELTGVNAYLSTLAIEDIANCNLLEKYNLEWSTASEFYRYWENNNCSFN